MKKITLICGALLAFAGLQACGTAEDSATRADEARTSSDIVPVGTSPAVMPDARDVFTGSIALGDDGMVDVEGLAQNGAFIGVGVTDATLCGDGRAGCTAACPEPCLAPGFPYGCGACASRGVFGAGVITANLTLNNTTGTGFYGSCSMQDLTVCSTDPVVTVNECAPNGTVNSCNGNPVTFSGTLPPYNAYDTIPQALINGFCMDATLTPCVAADSTMGAFNRTCGGAGSCSDNAAPCTATDLSLCTDPMTATCSALIPPMIGDGRCWSGCGTCTAGRAFNCAEFVYTGHHFNGGGGDLKCTCAPYSMTAPEVGLDTLVLGTVAMGGNLPFVLQLNGSDNSYCLHTFVIRDDAYGDMAGQGCTATCGDGVIAATNGETCEPRREYPDATPPIMNDLGCTDALPTCSGCNSCIP